MRDFIVSSGTGLEKSSYSLQYSQDRLQRRMGMICARMGWSVERSPLVMTRNSRMRRLAMSRRRRWEDFVIAFSKFLLQHKRFGGGNGCRLERRDLPGERQ